jgi:microcystin degradation protein MlrC
MRVAIGGISHETSTFATTPTTLENFDVRGLAEGQVVLDRFAGTKTGLGGFLDAGREAGFECVPILAASATPGGVVTAEATTTLTERLTAGIRRALAAGPLDGVLLSLHGAMVSELDDDGERYILAAVREVVGPELPILVELDLHGNISQEMVDLATVVIAYDEYPHTDPYERGVELGLLLPRILRGELRPVMAFEKVPLLAGVQRQYTHAEPMLGIKRLTHQIEAEPGMIALTYLPGFPWADIPATGFSVIATGDGDEGRARDAARRLASEVWERRDEFVVRPVPVEEAVRRAMAAPAGPVVLADIGDNPGGGTPADGTVLLDALLRLGARNTALAALNDPAVVEAAVAAGEGATIQTRLGGKVDRFHGEPLTVSGRVVRLTDGRFRHTGPMSTGLKVHMGPTAVLELDGTEGGRVQVVVTTHRYQPTDLGVLRSQGIEPTAQKILAVKSSVHFRAAFSPIAAEIVEVDTPGLTSPHLETLTYRRLTRPIYPFDRETTWPVRA